MNKKIIVKNQNNLPTIDYHKLKILQGDLKTLSKENLTKLCNSIKRYGYFVPAFIWCSGNDLWILDATQRYRALEQLEKEGYEIPEIPYIEIEAKDRKDAAEKLLQITSRYGEINSDTTFFEDFNIDLSFINDIEIPELDIKLEELESEIVEEEVPEPPIEPVSKMGDLWLCGKHKILVGDATKEADILKLMDGKKADMVFTDPPYGMNLQTEYDGIYQPNHPTAKRNSQKAQHHKSIIGDDIEFNPSLIFEWFKTKEIFLCGADYYCQNLPKGGSWIVWDKTGGHDSLLTVGLNSNFELIWSKNPHKRDIARITYKGVAGMKKEDGKRVHPAQKPVGLITWFFERYKGDIVVDLYLGSGTTLIAAHQTGRICYGCEIDPHYIDVILDRYAKFTGSNPIREDGVSWAELKKEHQ